MNHAIRKEYESHNDLEINNSTPIIIKIGLKNASKIYKNIYEPYDSNYEEIIEFVANKIMSKIGAKFGYFNSNEIVLIINNTSNFKNKFSSQSSASIFSSIATTYFIRKSLEIGCNNFIENFTPTFKCKIFNLDTKDDVISYMISKEKNAILSSIRRHSVFYNIDNIDFKSKYELKKELYEKFNFEWKKEPEHKKSGTYLRKRKNIEKLQISEISRLSNIEDVIFYNENPTFKNYENNY